MLLRWRVENAGLSLRDLPANRNTTAYVETRKDLSPEALKLWNSRKYGAIAASILGDEVIKKVLNDLSGQERQLLGHYLVGKVASDDLPTIRQLPEGHPQKAAYSEIFGKERRAVSGLTTKMEAELAERLGQETAVEIVGDVSEVLAGAADDAKRIFLRPVTPEFSQDSRDDTIALRMRARMQELKQVKEIPRKQS